MSERSHPERLWSRRFWAARPIARKAALPFLSVWVVHRADGTPRRSARHRIGEPQKLVGKANCYHRTGYSKGLGDGPPGPNSHDAGSFGNLPAPQPSCIRWAKAGRDDVLRPDDPNLIEQVAASSLLVTVHVLGAPRIRIEGHIVGAHLSLFAGVFGGPSRIVKLIGHAKSAHAARGCPTLLNGDEAAIGGSESPVDVKQSRRQHERRNNFGHKAHLDLLAVIEKTPPGQHPFRRSSAWIKGKNPKARLRQQEQSTERFSGA